MKRNVKLLTAFLWVATLSYVQADPLFNGKNLKGWEIVGGSAEYKVEDKTIVGYSKMNTENTFLKTKKPYTNFILEYEMFLGEGLNSGVQIRSNSLPEYKNGRFHGPQVEADDSPRRWFGGIFDEARKGWRYPLEYNPDAKKAYKRGEWNKIKVVASGKRIVTWVNGIPTANLIEEEAETGYIGLQVHSIGDNKDLAGKTIKWRNINLEEIDANYAIKSSAPLVSYALNELTDEQKKDGWKLLWDGKTTDGWVGAKLDQFPKKGWEIKDGILSVLSSGGGESEHGGDIVTTKAYKSFILEVDFKFTEGANSGIKYFVDPALNKGAGSAIGCEFQILDDGVHPDAKKGTNGNRTIGSLYDLIRADAKQHNPHIPREKYVNKYKWNRARVEVRGNKIAHYLNGIKVIEYVRSNQQWRALVAYSKYAKWPSFGELEEGVILLQDHGDLVSFKNIKIKELE